jgi:outer membrane immunogenic protein
MYKKLLALALAGVFSGSAFAADDFTGFYVGGNVGSSNADSDTSVALGGTWSIESQGLRDSFTSSFSDLSPSGTSYGVQLGYDFQFDNNFVLGIEFDYNQLGLDQARPASATNTSGVIYNAITRVDADQMYSLRPKFGYAFENTMLYATAGWAWTSTDFSAEVLSSGNYSKAGAASETLSSVVWGAGVEHKFGNNWSLRLEYLNVNGDDTSYNTAYRAGSTFVTPAYLETINQDLDYDIIRIGVNYRF